MLRLCCLWLAVLWIVPAFGMEPAAELDYAIDQPLMTIRRTELRTEDRQVFMVLPGKVLHIDWEDGDRLLTTVDGQRVSVSRGDLRPISEAADSFTQQLILDPSNTLLFLSRSRAYDLLGRQRSALADTNSADLLMPQRSEITLRRGLQAGNGGDLYSAWCEAILMQMFDPFEPSGYLLSGVIAMKLDDQEAAWKYLGAALELDPNNPDSQKYLAILLSRTAKSAVEWEVVVGILDEVIRLNPYNGQALEFRRKAHRQLDHESEAKADMAACRRLCDSWLRGCPENPQFWIDRGQLLFELESWTESLTDFTEAIRLDPNDVEPRDYRVRIRLKQRNARGALEDLTRLVELEPRNARYRLKCAVALLLTGENRQAIAELDELLRYAPEHGYARQLRAETAVTVGDWKTAEADFRYLLSHRASTGRSNAELASLAASLGDEAQALTLLQGDPDQLNAAEGTYLKLARRALHRGDLNAAQTMLTQSGASNRPWQLLNAISHYLVGDVDGARDQLGQIYVAGTKFQMGKNKEANPTTETGDQAKSGGGKSLEDGVRNLGIVEEFTPEGVAKAASISTSTGSPQIVELGLKSSGPSLHVKTIEEIPGLFDQSTAIKTASDNTSTAEQPQVESQSNETAQIAQFWQGLFKIQHGETSRGLKVFCTNGIPPSHHFSAAYVMIRIRAVDRDQQHRDGSFATKHGEIMLQHPETPDDMRIPVYEAIAAGNAELGKFDEAVRWQRRILDETPRDHPRRVWYWDIHQRYIRNEKYPLGETDPDLVLPVLRHHLNLENAPGLLTPLPPPLPE